MFLLSLIRPVFPATNWTQFLMPSLPMQTGMAKTKVTPEDISDVVLVLYCNFLNYANTSLVAILCLV